MQVENKIKYLEEKISKTPNLPSEAKLAGLYLDAGYIGKSIEHCINVIRNYPKYLTAYLILAKCFTARKEFHHAYLTLQRADKLFPLLKPIKSSFGILDNLKNKKSIEFKTEEDEEFLFSKFSEKSRILFSTFDEIITLQKEIHEEKIDEDDITINKSIETIEKEKSTLNLSLLGDEFLTIDDFEISKTDNKKYKVLEVDELGDIRDKGEKSRIFENISKEEIVKEIISEELPENESIIEEINNKTDLHVSVKEESEIAEPVLSTEPFDVSQSNDIVNKNLTPPPLKKFDLIEEINKLNEYDNDSSIGIQGKSESDNLITEDYENSKNAVPEPFMNKTLAGIYESQGKYEEAIEVYNQLFLNETITQEEYNIKISELRQKIMDSSEKSSEIDI